jgi:D-alanyl-D-alanine carboxypeptidase (penicillin-binding protein 5/6)
MKHPSKIKGKFAAVLIALLILIAPQSVYAYDYDYSAYPDMGVLIYEVSSGEILTQSNTDKTYYPGSITKVLTALTAMDYLDLDTELTVTQEELDLVQANSSLAYLEAGEELTFKQLLYALLLPSGNDAAKVIAVNAGAVILDDSSASTEACYEAFVEEMNRKAQEIGMTSSHFSNSDGYDDTDNYSTAQDLILLGEAAVSNDTIKEIVATKHIYVRTNKSEHNWNSTNYFINDSSDGQKYLDDRILGIKTGFTDIGGRCFLLYGVSDGMEIIGVVLNATSSTTTLWNRCSSIVDYVFDNFTMVDVVNDENVSYDYTIANHALLSDSTLTVAALDTSSVCIDQDLLVSDVEMELSFDEDLITVTSNGKLKLSTDIEAGQVVAEATFTSGDNVIATVSYVAMNDAVKRSYIDYIFYVLLVVFIVSFAAALAKDIKKNQKKRAERNGR